MPQSNKHISEYVHHLPRLIIQDMLESASFPDVISFAAGLPDTALFPMKLLQESFNLVHCDRANFQYAEPKLENLEIICDFLKQRNINVVPNELLITNGAQQGINILARYFVDRDKTVLVEDLTYPGFIQNIKALRPNIKAIKVNQDEGIDLEYLEQTLKNNSQISLIYVIPDGHNPLGTSWSQQKRYDFLNLMQRYNVQIIEDDAYGLISYSNQSMPLYSLDKKVIYLGTLSKVLMPALRIGWIAAPEKIITKLKIIKDSIDINTNSFSHTVGCQMIKSPSFLSHLDFIRKEYKLKRDAMLLAIKDFFPKNSKYNIPEHGIFIWVSVPDVDFHKLFFTSISIAKVSFIPGNMFSLDSGNYKDCIRLNFTYVEINQIRIGVKALGESIKRYLINS